ncbi:hypothetical protein R8Z50_20480 [Longispora sp. K20-0274]|uniref:hypothetical protein n=1 Tax=Longispora sp. K20-0274 TaxID=3088255 RepID=UPI00399ACC3B
MATHITTTDNQDDHDDLRRECFEQLRSFMSTANMDGALTCAVKLRETLPHRDDLRANLVLIAYGGGKDSSYMLAFVRLMQLLLHRVHGSTFRIRSVTNRHAGMPRAVMDNIDRVYRALGLFDDPDCELLLIDGDEVSPFDAELPQRPHVIERNRLDILMTGHRTFADGRPTFCNSCNLSMVNAFGLAAGYQGGVDIIITGDSREEQRAYFLWVKRLAARFGLATAGVGQGGFGSFLSTTNDIAKAYFSDIFGPDAHDTIAERKVAADVSDRMRFFSIYGDTEYSAKEHWDLLTDFLKFEFDDLAFSFTESDCANPALMAHLRGLKSERLFGRGYGAGIAEYVEFAATLMGKKDFPEHLVEVMRDRYSGAESVTRMRTMIDRYAADAYGLTTDQLICMVFSPFSGAGTGLADYLTREQPRLVPRLADIHALLAGTGDDDALAAELRAVSGLELHHLRVLYAAPAAGTRVSADATDLIGAILDGDPHKEVIRTRHAPEGAVVLELLSGR